MLECNNTGCPFHRLELPICRYAECQFNDQDNIEEDKEVIEKNTNKDD
jgi:hypothetical protein